MMRNGHPGPGNHLPAQDFYQMDVPAAPQRKSRLLPWALGISALLAVLCLGGIFLAVIGSGATPPASSSTTLPATAKSRGAVKAAPPAAAPATIGDGTYEVGSEIKAGTYTTTAPDDVIMCSWERLRNFNNDVNSTIAVDILTPNARGRVTIKASDAGVKFSGGCKWAKS